MNVKITISDIQCIDGDDTRAKYVMFRQHMFNVCTLSYVTNVQVILESVLCVL
jgi:hypothetical protein